MKTFLNKKSDKIILYHLVDDIYIFLKNTKQVKIY